MCDIFMMSRIFFSSCISKSLTEQNNDKDTEMAVQKKYSHVGIKMEWLGTALTLKREAGSRWVVCVVQEMPLDGSSNLQVCFKFQ